MAKSAKTKYHLGCSGWHYDDWKGVFYPKELPKSKWLPYYAGKFNTVEINNSFYQLPKKDTFRKWYEQSPEHFRFSVKGSRYITHLKKLNDIKKPLHNFYDHASLLEEKLGCVLWQLPPNLHKDVERLKGFCQSVSSDFKNVIEFRHKSWFTNKVYDVLAENKVAFCIISTPEFPETAKSTADFAYVRLHGKSSDWYKYDYSNEELQHWNRKIKALKVKELYAYFNNDYDANAVRNCQTLMEMI